MSSNNVKRGSRKGGLEVRACLVMPRCATFGKEPVSKERVSDLGIVDEELPPRLAKEIAVRHRENGALTWYWRSPFGSHDGSEQNACSPFFRRMTLGTCPDHLLAPRHSLANEVSSRTRQFGLVNKGDSKDTYCKYHD